MAGAAHDVRTSARDDSRAVGARSHRARSVVGDRRTAAQSESGGFPSSHSQTRRHRARGSAPAMRRDAGVTLIEVLVAVTLLSLLTVGMMYAMSVGFQAFQKTDRTLMENRRVAGAQRILE